MTDPKIAIITPMWGRHELVRVAQRQLAHATRSAPAHRYLIGSERDASAQVAADCCARYLEAPNILGDKMNAGVAAAIADHPDLAGVLVMGSDDMLSAGAFRLAYQAVQDGVDLFGWLDFYRFFPPSRLCYWAGYDVERRLEPIGAGRYYSRHVIDALDGELWAGGIRKGCDGVALIRALPHCRSVRLMRQDPAAGAMLFGIQDEITMTSWTTLSVVESDPAIIESAFSPRLVATLTFSPKLVAELAALPPSTAPYHPRIR